MENRKNTGRRRHTNNNLLLIVLIGFCILALIEILYGQAQMKVEKERLALAEENNQTVQELKDEWNQIKEGTSVVTQEGGAEQPVGGKEENEEPPKVVEQSAKPVVKDDQAGKDQEKEEEEDDNDSGYDMQIVILGDSIMDHDRTESGPAAIIAQSCNAKVYNMAMGGTTAALLPGEPAENEKWESRCLLGVVRAIQGKIDSKIFNGYPAKEVLDECDFDKTDYFIIEYGVNDFLSGQIPQSKYLEDGNELNVGLSYTYTGALDDAVTSLMDSFPNAKILIVAPHYCQVFSGRTFMGDAYSLDYGYGPLINFARGAGYVYDQHKEDNVIFYNAFELSGINAETADDYLEDGVHMTPLGSRVYAEAISRVINKDFRPEE